MALNESITRSVLFNVHNDMMVVFLYNTVVVETEKKKLYHYLYGLFLICTYM